MIQGMGDLGEECNCMRECDLGYCLMLGLASSLVAAQLADSVVKR